LQYYNLYDANQNFLKIQGYYLSVFVIYYHFLLKGGLYKGSHLFTTVGQIKLAAFPNRCMGWVRTSGY
jgi:hypothetical protein